MATNLGTAVNFAFPTTTGGITITNFTGLLQNVRLSEEGDMEEVFDGDGDLASETHFNRSQVASFEIIVTGATIAAAITASALATNGAKGMFLPITACAGMPEMVSNYWRIQQSEVSKDNKTSAKISFTVKKNANITAAATAS